MFYFLNEDKTYRPCESDEWSTQFENIDRAVRDDIIGGVRVSTVWLGVDHNFYGGSPLLFETMVFSTPKDLNDIYMKRYTTWDEAVEGHNRAIKWVRDECKEDE